MSKKTWDRLWSNKNNSYISQEYRFFRNMQKLSILSHYIEFKKGQKILDIGCGSGEGCLLLTLLHNVEPYGIDISEYALIKCKETFGEYKKNIELKNNESDKIAFPGNYFDITLNFGVLEHSHDIAAELNENYRVLKEGGSAIFVVPNLFSIGVIDRCLKIVTRRWPFGYQREISTFRMRKILKRAGFSNVIAFSVPRNRSSGKRNILFGWYTYAIAKK